MNPTRRTLALASLAIAAIGSTGASVQAADASQPSSAELSLLQSEDARFRAQIAGDVETLARSMAEDLVYTHASGRRQTRSEYLQDIRSGRIPYRSIEAKDRVARVFANVGITRGLLHMVVGDQELSSSFLGVYVKRGGRWQLLDWQSSPAPPPTE